MESFTYAELDLLDGEFLPERAVLSALMGGGGYGGGGGDSYNNNNVAWGHGHHWHGAFAVVNACQSDISHPDDGLLQLVGLHAQHDAASFTCEPGTVVSH
jgi:hypothetical protein